MRAVQMLRRTTLLVLILGALAIGGLAATPPSGSISSGSAGLAVDFAPVVAGTFTNVGAQDLCPPGICDNYDLTVVLPAPAATFYQNNTAKLTIKYTWNSAVASDLDIFAI